MKNLLDHNIASNKRGASARRKPRASSKNTSRRKTNKTTVSQMRLFVTAVVTVIFMLGLFALNKISLENTSTNNSPATTNTAGNQKADKSTAIPAQESEAEEYTFYSKLKDFEVLIPENTGYESQRELEKDYFYLIQAGSFKTGEQAERRLVELKLLALDPKVSSAVNSSGNRWYRVRLGPFKSRREMAAVRNTIISNGIEAMVMRRSPK